VSSRRYRDPGADGRAVALLAHQLKQDTMIGILGLVYEERWRCAHVEDHKVDVAVIVDITESDASAGLHRVVVQTAAGGDLFEDLVAHVVKE
jgi:hypothetical protein